MHTLNSYFYKLIVTKIKIYIIINRIIMFCLHWNFIIHINPISKTPLPSSTTSTRIPTTPPTTNYTKTANDNTQHPQNPSIQQQPKTSNNKHSTPDSLNKPHQQQHRMDQVVSNINLTPPSLTTLCYEGSPQEQSFQERLLEGCTLLFIISSFTHQIFHFFFFFHFLALCFC